MFVTVDANEPGKLPSADELNAHSTAALLCYLAVSELAAVVLHDAPSTDTQLVESARIWLARHALDAGWLERVTFARKARRIAKRFAVGQTWSAAQLQPSNLFLDATTTNPADPVVAQVWRACSDADAVN
ncbi:hypothetical protein N0A02_24885 [Paraburkholderia acidicola]|uniref:Uncharacterized protein n=1 Tax=Paraburkholderia acidicola TaxID=1912599 RepID=A0ABV1LTX2_9BURK